MKVLTKILFVICKAPGFAQTTVNYPNNTLSHYFPSVFPYLSNKEFALAQSLLANTSSLNKSLKPETYKSFIL